MARSDLQICDSLRFHTSLYGRIGGCLTSIAQRPRPLSGQRTDPLTGLFARFS
jgi:hypothetical protein